MIDCQSSNGAIPQCIHYCWFGRGPLPELALKCLASWKKYLPDYEIIEWNEDKFDINAVNYTREAYDAKKFAFVSDYARYWILYKYGGLYFDTDVEVIKPIDDIVAKGSFMGCESLGDDFALVNPGLGIGATAGHPFYKEMLDRYSNLHFIDSEGKLNLQTVVYYTTESLKEFGLRNIDAMQNVQDLWIYPKEYFCPKNYDTGVVNLTANTRTIHHYSASWYGRKDKVYRFVREHFGDKIAKICSGVYYFIFKR